MFSSNSPPPDNKSSLLTTSSLDATAFEQGNSPIESSTNTIRISTGEGETRGVVEDREYTLSLRVRGTLNVHLDLKIDEKMLAAATERKDEPSRSAISSGNPSTSKFNVSITEPSFNVPRVRDIPHEFENRTQCVSSTTSEQVGIEDDEHSGYKAPKRARNLSPINDNDNAPVSSSVECEPEPKSNARRSLENDDECEVTTSALDNSLDQTIDESFFDEQPSSSGIERSFADPTQISVSENSSNEESNPSKVVESNCQNTMETSISDELNNSMHNEFAGSSRPKKQKGVIILCSHAEPKCRQRAITSYQYCIRHILLDKNAPYKRCQHRRKPKNKSEEPQYCTNAIRSDRPENFCSTHMIMNGLKDPKPKAKKIGTQEQKDSSFHVVDDDFADLDFDEFDHEFSDQHSLNPSKQITSMHEQKLPPNSSQKNTQFTTSGRVVSSRQDANGTILIGPPSYESSLSSANIGSYPVCAQIQHKTVDSYQSNSDSHRFAESHFQQQFMTNITHYQQKGNSTPTMVAGNSSKFLLPSASEMYKPNIQHKTQAAPPMPSFVQQQSHFNSPNKNEQDGNNTPVLKQQKEEFVVYSKIAQQQTQLQQQKTEYVSGTDILSQVNGNATAPCSSQTPQSAQNRLIGGPTMFQRSSLLGEDYYHSQQIQQRSQSSFPIDSGRTNNSILSSVQVGSKSSTPTFFVPSSPAYPNHNIIQQQQQQKQQPNPHQQHQYQQHFAAPPQSPASLPAQFISRTSTPGSIGSGGGPASLPAAYPPRPPSQQIQQQQRRDSSTSLRRPSSSLLPPIMTTGGLTSTLASPPIHHQHFQQQPQLDFATSNREYINHANLGEEQLSQNGANRGVPSQILSAEEHYGAHQNQYQLSHIVKQHPNLAKQLLPITFTNNVEFKSSPILPPQQQIDGLQMEQQTRDIRSADASSRRPSIFTDDFQSPHQFKRPLPQQISDSSQYGSPPQILAAAPHAQHNGSIVAIQKFVFAEKNQQRLIMPDSEHATKQQILSMQQSPIVLNNQQKLTKYVVGPITSLCSPSPFSYLNIEPPPIRYNVETEIQLADNSIVNGVEQEKFQQDYAIEQSNRSGKERHTQQRVIKLRQKRQKVHIKGKFRNQYPEVENMCQILEAHDFDKTDLFPLGLEPSDDEDSSSEDSFPSMIGESWFSPPTAMSKIESYMFQNQVSEFGNGQAQRLELYLLKKQLRLESLRLVQNAKVSIPINYAARIYPNSVGASLRVRKMNKRREQLTGVKPARLRRCSHVIQKPPKSDMGGKSTPGSSVPARCTNFSLPNAHHCTEHISYNVKQRLFVYCNYPCCREPVVFTDSLLFNNYCRQHFSEQRDLGRKRTRSTAAAALAAKQQQQRRSSTTDTTSTSQQPQMSMLLSTTAPKPEYHQLQTVSNNQFNGYSSHQQTPDNGSSSSVGIASAGTVSNTPHFANSNQYAVDHSNDIDEGDVSLASVAKDLGFDGLELTDMLSQLPVEASLVSGDIDDDNGFLCDISKMDAGDDALSNTLMNSHTWADVEQFLSEQPGFQEQNGPQQGGSVAMDLNHIQLMDPLLFPSSSSTHHHHHNSVSNQLPATSSSAKLPVSSPLVKN